MHAQVITFGLNGITEDQFRDAASADVPIFQSLPGLVGKVWLRDPETNTYGGIYLWADRESYEGYLKGEVFNALRSDEHLKDFASRDYGTFDDLSALTMSKLQPV